MDQDYDLSPKKGIGDELGEIGRTTKTPKDKWGRWTTDEHERFLEGVKRYGRQWKMVQHIVKTRTTTQVRTHAQKFFEKQYKEHIVQKEKRPSHTPNLKSDRHHRAYLSEEEDYDDDADDPHSNRKPILRPFPPISHHRSAKNRIDTVLDRMTGYPKCTSPQSIENDWTPGPTTTLVPLETQDTPTSKSHDRSDFGAEDPMSLLLKAVDVADDKEGKFALLAEERQKIAEREKKRKREEIRSLSPRKAVSSLPSVSQGAAREELNNGSQYCSPPSPQAMFNKVTMSNISVAIRRLMSEPLYPAHEELMRTVLWRLRKEKTKGVQKSKTYYDRLSQVELDLDKCRFSTVGKAVQSLRVALGNVDNKSGDTKYITAIVAEVFEDALRDLANNSNSENPSDENKIVPPRLYPIRTALERCDSGAKSRVMMEECRSISK